MIQDIADPLAPLFCELADLSRQTPDQAERLGPTIAAVAGLTAGDGAGGLRSRYDLLGFGAKIARRKGGPQIEQGTLTEPVENDKPVLVHAEQLGGTRHLSAAQFIQDQRDAVALVASQDGRFTVFEWSPCENMVHAHRLDVLLL